MKLKITRTDVVKHVLMEVTVGCKDSKCKVIDDGSVYVWSELYDAWRLPAHMILQVNNWST